MKLDLKKLIEALVAVPPVTVRHWGDYEKEREECAHCHISTQDLDITRMTYSELAGYYKDPSHHKPRCAWRRAKEALAELERIDNIPVPF